MISHVVLMKPKADLSQHDRGAFLDAFSSAVDNIPTVRGVRVGQRVRHGAGYERTAPDVDYIAVIDFDDAAGLQAYLMHPAHQELGARFGDAMALAIVYDFEVGGAKDFTRWRTNS